MITTTIIFVFLLLGLVFYFKRKLYTELLLSFIISFTWVAYYGYNYKGTNLFLVGNINLFALVAWTLGLTIFLLTYRKLKAIYGFQNAILYSGIIYLGGINIIEWIGYNWLKIQLASSYHGLFGLELMHGPPILKAYYLTAWLIAIIIYEKTR